MPHTPPVTDKDGNKTYRSEQESLANLNVTRPAPLESERADKPETDSSASSTATPTSSAPDQQK